MTDSLKDYLGEEFFVGDTICTAASNGIRVGVVTKFNKSEYTAADGTEVSRIHGYQINREYEKGKFKKQSFFYSQHDVYLVKKA